MKCLSGSLLILVGIKYLAAALPLILLFLYALQLFYLRTSRQLRHMDLEAKSPLYTHLLETVQGLSTIRSFGWSSTTLATGLKFLDISQRPYYLLFCIQRWLNLVLDFFIAALAVLFVGVAVSVEGVGE
jgi:ATP-binding cassette subfamily C (CFTR/MRP) protein 1